MLSALHRDTTIPPKRNYRGVTTDFKCLVSANFTTWATYYTVIIKLLDRFPVAPQTPTSTIDAHQSPPPPHHDPMGRHKTHGASHTPTYKSWVAMRQRCENPADPSYKRYGERGIKVCKRWALFANFLSDMGTRPPGRTLERKENDGHYAPGNCRWATLREQANNTRRNRFVSVGGKHVSIAEAARMTGVPERKILTRLNAGWPEARALCGRRREEREAWHAARNPILSAPSLPSAS